MRRTATGGEEVNGDYTFTLTESERSEVGLAAEVLTKTPPQLVDTDAWVSACRAMSCGIPQRMCEGLREFRHDPGPDGVFLIRNLPVGAEYLPPTPMVAESVERQATVGASVIVLMSLQLGEIVAFRNEKAGALVQNVVPVPGQEKQQSNAGSTPLEMHIENAFHPNRPDYVALLCVRNDPGRQAALRLASIRRAVVKLSPHTRTVLGEVRFLTEPPPSFGSVAAGTPHAVLTGDFDDPDVRIDFNSSEPLDPEAREAVSHLRDSIESVARPIHLEPGDLAFVDNRITLHGRSFFEPRYDGSDRWLHRTFIHLDHRRSREMRPAGGHVID
jgi:L-asparagine oxygenase